MIVFDLLPSILTFLQHISQSQNMQNGLLELLVFMEKKFPAINWFSRGITFFQCCIFLFLIIVLKSCNNSRIHLKLNLVGLFPKSLVALY
ncbi:hypothetical protein HanRHA438_Chr15g0708381 [Helianthus annuus]|nr:hypothetical protein HanRHA438_Chr15g0708381 [Helianthus annuus]